MKKPILIASVLAFLLCAPGAQASTVALSSPGGSANGSINALTYTAAEGESNAVALTRSATSITVADPGATIARGMNGAACEISSDGHLAVCTDADGFGRLDAALRDLDDTAVSEMRQTRDGERFSTSIGGGAGDDALTGSDSLADSLLGGLGDDTLVGRGGDDFLSDFDFGFFGSTLSGGTNVIAGGDGDDVLYDGPGDDTLRGEAGDDRLVADAGGDDQVTGGVGQDLLDRPRVLGDQSAQTASFDGGPGEDGVRYTLYENFRTGEKVTPDSPGATVRLDAGGPTTDNGLPGQRDTLVSVENASGSVGSDSLTGSAGPNRLSGFAGNDSISAAGGNDSIVGGAGLDVIDAGAGRDSVDARDNEADRVRCGDGPEGDPGDTAFVDDVDELDRCPAAGAGTTVMPSPRPTKPAPPPAPPPPPTPPAPPAPPVTTAPPRDLTGPDLTGTRIPRAIKLADLRRRGLRVVLGSRDRDRVLGVATLTGRLKGRAPVTAIGDLIIAQKTQGFTRQATVRLKPTRKLGRSIRRGSRLRVVVEVRDLAGNLSLVAARVRVR